MDLRLERLSDALKKLEPACSVCGYDALFILKVGSLEKLFCEPDLRDALLDAINFSCKAPDSL